jgi:hypothetical protein
MAKKPITRKGEISRLVTARQQITRQIKEITKRRMKKAIQITKQKAGGNPLKYFPKTDGLIAIGKEGLWAARITVGKTTLLIEPVSEKEPWIIKTTDGRKVRVSKEFEKELNDALWRMWNRTYPKKKRKITRELGVI